jgi:outer membrane receptor protein involved in Fe transport
MRFILLTIAPCIGGALLTVPLPAQGAGRVVGIVREAETLRPLENATVSVARSRTGATTGRDGSYAMGGVTTGVATVRVQLLGYAPTERAVSVSSDSATVVDFVLVPLGLALDAVVVTGTVSSARLREVGHDIARIDVQRVAETIASLDHLLAARVPGLTALQSSGVVGSGSQIRLRGNTSITLSNQPLVYLDGVRLRSDGFPKNVPIAGDARRGVNDVPSPLDDINVSDIERVEVVKGPAATTLYGAEAATGVLQIFTRRGSSGGPAWRAQVEHGFDHVRPYGTPDEPYMRLDPWLRTAQRQRYGVSVSGGGPVRYFVSSVVDHNEGVLPRDEERRIVLRSNLDVEPAAKLRVSISSSYTKHDLENTPAGPNAQGLTMNVYRGTANFLGDTSRSALARILDWNITTAIDHAIVGVATEYAVTPTLTQRVTLGTDRAQSDMHQLRPYGFVFQPGGVLSDIAWQSAITSLQYVGQWEHRESDDVTSTLAWGGERVWNTVTSESRYAEGFPGPGEESFASGAIQASLDERVRIITAGVFGQLVVGVRNRYFATAGLRLDGSSAFGNAHGWERYPRASLSYVISDEPFWPRALGRVKLRASYGHAGRAPGAFDALRSWTATTFDGAPAYVPNTAGDSTLGAERTRELEVGLDGSWLGERLTMEVTRYDQRTTDAIFPVTQIPSLGFVGTQRRNIGSLRNTGIELAVSAAVVRGARWAWDAGVSLATNHSTVSNLGGAPSFVTGEVGWIIEGEPAPVLRGARVRNPEAIGEPDIEPDHLYGPNLPTRTIGANTTLRFPGGIELSVRGEYMGGHYIYDHASNHLARAGTWPVCNDAYDRIAAGAMNQLTAWERVWCVAANAPRQGPIYPADFFRLRALTLAMPVTRLVPGARCARLTVSGRNLWTWKNHDLLVFDPEMVGRDGMHSTVRAIDLHVPAPATLTFAVAAEY